MHLLVTNNGTFDHHYFVVMTYINKKFNFHELQIHFYLWTKIS